MVSVFRNESRIKQNNRQERRKEMIRRTRAWFAANRPGYTPVDKGVSTKCDKCKCGEMSMIRYYTPDMTEIVRVCIRRFDSRTDKQCGGTNKVFVGYDQKKKVEETTASAAV